VRTFREQWPEAFYVMGVVLEGFRHLDAFAMATYGINNQGELEARIRIAKEKEEAEALAASVGADW